MHAVRFLIPYIKPYKRLFFLGILCSALFGAFSGLGIPILFEKVFKVVFESKTSIGAFQISIYALSLPLIFTIRGMFGFLSTYFLNKCALYALKDLKESLFTKLQRLQLAFYDAHTSGDLINRMHTDPAVVQSVILDFASEFFRQGLQMCFGASCLLYFSIKNADAIFFLIFLLALPICLIPAKILRNRLRAASKSTAQAQCAVSETVLENLASTLEVRSFNLEISQIKQFLQRLSDYMRLELKVLCFQKMQQPLMESIVSLFIGIVFAYAFFKQIPFSIFSSMGLCLYFTLDPAKRILNFISNFHKIHGSLERIMHLLEAPIISEPATSQIITKPFEGTIDLNTVVFGYGKELLFKGLSVTIPKYTKYALVGHSGSGKSTFSKLILRLYEISGGSLCIDGIDIRTLPLSTLRQNIGLVPQQPVLFNDTIYNNILLGNSLSSQEAVEAAAKAAFAHSFIQDLPQKYQTYAGERGNKLSVGQKQRIAIARAFLKNSPILILDEATSALDSESEFFVQKALKELMRDKTVIMIAHRLSTIQTADCILVFQSGAIIAQGTHQQLLQTCPEYAVLVEKQVLTS